jgi:dTDP-4-amino-4,6-dideoxygalactose transaminase
VALDIGERTVSLPLWPGLLDAQIDRVVAALQSTLAGRP